MMWLALSMMPRGFPARFGSGLGDMKGAVMALGVMLTDADAPVSGSLMLLKLRMCQSGMSIISSTRRRLARTATPTRLVTVALAGAPVEMTPAGIQPATVPHVNCSPAGRVARCTQRGGQGKQNRETGTIAPAHNESDCFMPPHIQTSSRSMASILRRRSHKVTFAVSISQCSLSEHRQNNARMISGERLLAIYCRTASPQVF